jgi:hypothetical protein
MTPASPPSAVFGDAFVTQEAPNKRPTPFAPAAGLACFSQRAGSWCRATPFSPQPTSATRGVTGWVGTVEPPVMGDVTTFPASVRVDLEGPPLARQVLSSSTGRYVSAARVREGRTLLVTGAFDFVSWAEISGDEAELRVAVSPLPRGEITDLVLTDRPPPASEANFAEGWLIASGRVFRIFASTRALWRSSEVVLPTEVEVVRVWLDGPRPRAGDRNGVVFSLDSVVALSEPLPLGGQAVDYASACNNDFVLASGGQLYRLVAGPSVGHRARRVGTARGSVGCARGAALATAVARSTKTARPRAARRASAPSRGASASTTRSAARFAVSTSRTRARA